MRAGRIFYRVGQFWQALSAVPDAADIEQAQEYLTPAQMALFFQMQPAEQAHSLRVFKQLVEQFCRVGKDPPIDLLVAALLHDVGKSRHPLRVWERVMIVIVKACLPGLAERLGYASSMAENARADEKRSPDWRRAFIVAEQHPEWGAEMAAAAGVSPLAVSLIRKHQYFEITDPVNLESRLLQDLQAVDGNS